LAFALNFNRSRRPRDELRIGYRRALATRPRCGRAGFFLEAMRMAVNEDNFTGWQPFDLKQIAENPLHAYRKTSRLIK
jgi:hypothetical protein